MRNQIASFILLTTFLFSYYQVYSQSSINIDHYSIKWGDLVRFRGDVSQIVNINNDNFSAVVNQKNLFSVFLPNHRKMVIKEIRNFQPIAEQKIKLKGNGKRIAPQSVTDVGSDIVSLSTRTRLLGTRQEIFYNRINFINASKVEKGHEILSYYKMRSPVNKLIGTQSSDDFSKAAGYFNIPVRQGDFQGYGYVLFDEKKGLYDKNTIQLPYVNFQFEIADQFISNNGTFYTIGKEFYKTFPNRRWGLNNRFFAKSKIFKVSEGEFKDLHINPSNYIIQEIKITQDADENMVCSGFYADDAMSGVRGVFLIHLDKETNEVTTSQKVPFTQEFLSTGVAAWERTWRDRFISQNTRQQGMHNFRMLDLRMTDEGDFIGIAEHQEHEVKMKTTHSGSSENSQPTVKYEHYYYFDDLIVYKISKEGKLMWVNRIAKNQVAKDGNIRFASIAHGVGGQNILLVFNDNSWNYEDNGQFKERTFPRPMSLSKFWNVMALTTIDLASGEVNRTMMPGRKELNTVLIPRNCRFNYNKNEMFLHSAYGMRRNRFGKITLK